MCAQCLSNAFALLLKLWRFNHPPLEHGVGEIPPVGSQLTPEYLLLVRNSHLVSSENIFRDQNERRLAADASSSFSKPIFVDSFPKLKVWYRQHLACIASPLSGLVHGTPVHQIVDELLTMMFRKINRGSPSLTSATSGSSASSGPGEETCLRTQLAAWDILEAVPFVVDAALTACAHGKLSPGELCTAEVSRGVWKPVFMNGVDWPSPAANLSTVEEQIKKILAATGVDVPSLVAGEALKRPFHCLTCAYVSGFVSLMIGCTPTWVLEVDVEVLKRVSNGLRHWKEEELALSLRGAGGVSAMGAAAELIIETQL